MAENGVNERLFQYLKKIIYEPEKAVLDRRDLPEEVQPLAEGLDVLLQFVLEERRFGKELSEGHICEVQVPSRENVLASPLKAVYGMLKHLVWLMGEVAGGDYKQRLSAANDLSEAFNRMIAYLVDLSLRDKLTGLLNGDGFDERAAALIERDDREGTYFLVNIDVNGFKGFNTIYGSEKGDELLVRMARLLQSCCGEHEICARIHADDFMGLFLGQDEGDVVQRLEQKAENLWPQGNMLTHPFHIGLYAVPDEEIPIRVMRNYATFANRSIREDSLQYYASFDLSMAKQYAIEETLLEHFEQALANQEFAVYYQPKVDVRTEAVIGCEALVRWNSPWGEQVSPGAFINLLETNGLITLLDFYVLEQVCCKLRHRLARHLPVVPVAVNFSRTHVRDAGFVTRLLTILDRYGIAPAWIEVEITEAAFFESQEDMLFIVERLHRAGLTVAMDDFGSGFSSLNFLKNIPMDVMKIDKLFFDNFMTDSRVRLLVMDILSMARHLGLHTVAEGIELKEEVEFLRAHGCDVIQGYYFYKPLKSVEMDQVMDEAVKA